MSRCSPGQMRKNLMAVEVLKSAGMDFIPIPVKNEGHRKELAALGTKIFDEILEDLENGN